MSKMHLPRSST